MEALIIIKLIMARLMSDEIDLRINNITKERKKHFITIKESTHQKHIVVLNVYAPKNKDLEHINQKLTELIGKIDKPTFTIGDRSIRE